MIGANPRGPARNQVAWTAAPAARRVKALAVAALLAGCAGDGGPALIEAPPPIRLIDHVAGAVIDSPLLEAPARESLIDPAALPAEVAWRTDLGDFERLEQAGCRPLESGGVECQQDQGGFRLKLEVPAAQGAYTVIVPELRANEPECALLEALDNAERRRLSLPADAAEWRKLPILWPNRPATSEITLRLLRRRLSGPCRVQVRSVVTHGLQPDQGIGMALLERYQPAAGADDDRGVARFDVFLPLRNAETVRHPFDGNFGSREALLAPAPTEIRFRLRIPDGAHLGFSYALGQDSRPGDRVDFEVRAATWLGERRLWSGSLEASRAIWHWHDARVPLAGLAGREVELTLTTRSSEGSGVGLWGTPTVSVPRRRGDPPSVVLIAVDTLRADRLSAYGYPQPTSPRIDDFARDGVLFRQAIAQSNWTIPSFASIFTGQIVGRHRLATFTNRLPAEAPTLAAEFRRHGWRTHAVLFKSALYQRLEQGFETSFNVPLQRHLADRNLAKAVDWVRRQDERFFLFLHFDDPHQPFTQPPEYHQASSREGLARLGFRVPVNLRRRLAGCKACWVDGRVSEAVKSLANQLYDEEIRYVDDRIGRFLDELRRLDLYDDSVIAFVSDHGETLWSHYEFFGHGGANQHDELIRVPLIIKPPTGRGFRSGAVVASRVAAFDLMPTLLELAGLEPPGDLDARSLRGLLRAGAGEAEGDRVVFSQSAVSAAYLRDRWKYLLPVGRGAGARLGAQPRLVAEELYDMVADPGELRDLAAEEPALLRALRQEAIEHVIGAVGGRFLLVAGGAGPAPERLEVTCEPACSWDPLLSFGRERVIDGLAGADAFVGPGLGDGLLLVARLTGGGDARVRFAGRAVAEPAVAAAALPFVPGVVASVLGQGGPAAWLVAAPERGGGALEEATIDPQQEQALRALGYLQ